MLRRDQRPGDDDYFDMSFSGIKTALRNAARAANLDEERAHLARGFQDALVDTLVAKTVRAVKHHQRKRVVLGGGVACNQTLAAAMRAACQALGATVYAPSPRLATDNAAMVARAGLFHLERGERAPLDLDAHASLPIPGLIPA
jgi:N6-L-threonylcarbamoyladenine synthase